MSGHVLEAALAKLQWEAERHEEHIQLTPNQAAAVLARVRELEALVEQMREAGQALRDSFPDSSWQHSAAIADAADVWDALAAVPDPQEPTT